MQNHRSFRDLTELTLVQRRLASARPTDGSWADYTGQVAGIYGSNASGKSSVLSGIDFMREVVRRSATTWVERASLPQQPFRLDEDSRKAPSEYALDFVIDDVRYEYGFSFTRTNILSEWLYDYPEARRRLVYERTDGSNYRFGRSLRGGTVLLERTTGPRELVLSRAVTANHPILKPIAQALTEGINFAEFSDADRASRLRKITEGLAGGLIDVDDIVTLLKVADVGIDEVEVETSEAPPAVRKMLERFAEFANQESADSKPSRSEAHHSDDTSDDEVAIRVAIEHITQALAFRHVGKDRRFYTLPAGAQSTGTLNWLSLALPSVEALRRGNVLLIDELDASLHPQLAQVLVRMFRDRDYNRKGAQLIFTTHDTYFMSPAADSRLTAEEVWFTEKDGEGASELYSLDDFPVRGDQNLARRYLHGRYGAVPAVAPSFLAGLLSEERLVSE
jgi:AAA15 family ATPase/GTPase